MVLIDSLNMNLVAVTVSTIEDIIAAVVYSVEGPKLRVTVMVSN